MSSNTLEEIIKVVKLENSENLKLLSQKRKQYFENLESLKNEISHTKHRNFSLDRESKSLHGLYKAEMRPLTEKVNNARKSLEEMQILNKQKEEEGESKENERNREVENFTTENVDHDLLLNAEQTKNQIQHLENLFGVKFVTKDQYLQMVFHGMDPENSDNTFTITLEPSNNRMKIVDVGPLHKSEMESLQFTLDNDPLQFTLNVRKKFAFQVQ